jgi:hypothetical protein
MSGARSLGDSRVVLTVACCIFSLTASLTVDEP